MAVADQPGAERFRRAALVQGLGAEIAAEQGRLERGWLPAATTKVAPERRARQAAVRRLASARAPGCGPTSGELSLVICVVPWW